MMNLKSRKIYGAMIVLGCGLLTGLGIGITEYFRSKKESVPISSGTEQKPLKKHFCETLKQLYPDFEKAVPADHAGVYNILNSNVQELVEGVLFSGINLASSKRVPAMQSC